MKVIELNSDLESVWTINSGKNTARERYLTGFTVVVNQDEMEDRSIAIAIAIAMDIGGSILSTYHVQYVYVRSAAQRSASINIRTRLEILIL